MPPCLRCQTRASRMSSASPASAAPARRAEILVERDVDAVEQPGDLGVVAAVERADLPQPRAVEVQRDLPLARPAGLGDQVVPLRQPSADLPLRELEQQRRQRLGDPLEVGQRDHPVRVADQPAVQSVEQLVALLLVDLEMAGGMEGDACGSSRRSLQIRIAICCAIVPLGMKTAASAPTISGDPRLQPLDPLAGAVAVRPLVLGRRLGDLEQPLAHRRAAVPAVQVAVGAADRGQDALVVGHPPGSITSARAAPCATLRG